MIILASCNLRQPAQEETPVFPLVSPRNTPFPTTAISTYTMAPPGISEVYINGILDHSTEIVDPNQDWIVTGHEEDNSVIYPIDYCDINNMKLGLDNEYLYIKLTVNGTIPEDLSNLPTFSGDQLRGFGTNIGLDTDSNSQTGVISDGGTEAMLGWGIKNEDGIYRSNSAIRTQPTGTETPEDARYRNVEFNIKIQYGGKGFNFVILAIPLSTLMVTRSQEITLDAWLECSSDRYDHATFDALCPEGYPFNHQSLS